MSDSSKSKTLRIPSSTISFACSRQPLPFGFALLSVAPEDRPCFDRRDGLADRRVLLDIDRAVHRLVPHGRFVGPVHHVDPHLDCPGEGGRAAVLGYRLQLVRGALFHVLGSKREERVGT